MNQGQSGTPAEFGQKPTQILEAARNDTPRTKCGEMRGAKCGATHLTQYVEATAQSWTSLLPTAGKAFASKDLEEAKGNPQSLGWMARIAAQTWMAPLHLRFIPHPIHPRRPPHGDIEIREVSPRCGASTPFHDNSIGRAIPRPGRIYRGVLRFGPGGDCKTREFSLNCGPSRPFPDSSIGRASGC